MLEKYIDGPSMVDLVMKKEVNDLPNVTKVVNMARVIAHSGKRMKADVVNYILANSSSNQEAISVTMGLGILNASAAAGNFPARVLISIPPKNNNFKTPVEGDPWFYIHDDEVEPILEYLNKVDGGLKPVGDRIATLGNIEKLPLKIFLFALVSMHDEYINSLQPAHGDDEEEEDDDND